MIIRTYLFTFWAVFFAFCLALVVVAERYIIGWAFKGNIFKKNLNKIKDPSTLSFKLSSMMFAFSLITGTAMSWLGVLQYVFYIFWLPLVVIREALSPTPEEIKMLRFPLMNNPNLARESVWAYLHALDIKMGTEPSATQMGWNLEEISGFYPSFNAEVALKTLGSLVDIDPDTLADTMYRYNSAMEA